MKLRVSLFARDKNKNAMTTVFVAITSTEEDIEEGFDVPPYRMLDTTFGPVWDAVADKPEWLMVHSTTHEQTAIEFSLTSTDHPGYYFLMRDFATVVYSREMPWVKCV